MLKCEMLFGDRSVSRTCVPASAGISQRAERYQAGGASSEAVAGASPFSSARIKSIFAAKNQRTLREALILPSSREHPIEGNSGNMPIDSCNTINLISKRPGCHAHGVVRARARPGNFRSREAESRREEMSIRRKSSSASEKHIRESRLNIAYLHAGNSFIISALAS